VRESVFFFCRHLGKRSTIAIVRNEKAVVTKPIISALTSGDSSFTFARDKMHFAQPVHYSKNSPESRRPMSVSLEGA
jgi:hypothetical protein